jgi:acyl-CoA reductase-like NAD-dependent aldehyde dehydrogenase
MGLRHPYRSHNAVDNPATGAPLAVVQGAGEKEVDLAVRAAHAGHLAWRPARPVNAASG